MMNTGQTNSPTTAASGKKVRKPYTITKSRESWTDEEHDKFLEALQLFDRDWKKIEDFVGSKTVIQIRSHAQKYFLKVQKNGASAHVPPPRPKRKATHPYPQKSPNTLLASSQAAMPFSASFNPIAPGYPAWYDSSVAIDQATSGIAPSHDEYNLNMTEVTTGAKGFPRITSSALSAMGSLGGSVPASDQPSQEKNSVLHGLPDFAEVYGFIGSVFDPDTKGHVQKLKEMDPINFETNLTVNLSRPDFDEVRNVLSCCDTLANTVTPAIAKSSENQPTDLSC
ncbi:hypothetical protein KSS87_011663 [Heliosperma pusillum]|nr:hypothetical protein KSS87_011663 [Heliosperma pusillum]